MHGCPRQGWMLPGVRQPFVRAGCFPSLPSVLIIAADNVIKGQGKTRRINILQGVNNFESQRAGAGCVPSSRCAPWGARGGSRDWQGLR